MRTIIQIKTFMCPLGIGKLGYPDACRFHKAIYDLKQDEMCPIHNLLLEKTTLPEDCIIQTIAGEEDIEEEIEQIKLRKSKGEEKIMSDPDLSTLKKEDDHREKRIEDIRQAIMEAKEHEDL